MADESTDSQLENDLTGSQSSEERWFEDACKEAVGNEEDANDEAEFYERELLGEDDLSPASDGSAVGGEKGSKEDVKPTHSPASCKSESSYASASSWTSSPSSVCSVEQVGSKTVKRRLPSQSSDADDTGIKRVLLCNDLKKVETTSTDEDSDGPRFVRKRKLGAVIALSSTSSSSPSSSS